MLPKQKKQSNPIDILKTYETHSHASLKTPKKIIKNEIKEEIKEETFFKKPLKYYWQILKDKKDKFEMPNYIKYNWLGIAGSIIVIIGAVFFGLTSSIMQIPEFRIGALLIFSVLLFLFSYKIKKYPQLLSVSSWFNSIAGTIVLFTFLGAGNIEGLKCIQSQSIGFIIILLGISINIFLTFISHIQFLAAFHVILSLIAFYIFPQEIIFLPICSLITLLGLYKSYKSKWNLHILLILIAYSIFYTHWILELSSLRLSLSTYIISIFCTLGIGIFTVFIHYSKKYQYTKFEILPSLVHIVNWGAIGWNLLILAKFSILSTFCLGFVSILSFILALIAKKRKTDWLYYTDTIIGQTFMIFTIASLSLFSVKLYDIFLMLFVQISIFNIICLIKKQELFLRFGYAVQSLNIFALLIYSQYFLSHYSSQWHTSLFIREISIFLLSLIFYAAVYNKKLIIDTLSFIIKGIKISKYPISILISLSATCLIVMYCYAYSYWLFNSIVFLMILSIGAWRKRKEDFTSSIIILGLLSLINLINMVYILKFIDIFHPNSYHYLVYFIPIIIIDLIFVLFKNYLSFSLIKKNIHDIFVYAIMIQISLLSYSFSKETSRFFFGLVLLAFSLIFLEVGKWCKKKYNNPLNLLLQNSFIISGILFIIGFIEQYISVHLQVNYILNSLPLRWITDVLGILTISYWIYFLPNKGQLFKITKKITYFLPDLLIGFVTLCILTEFLEIWRPTLWIILATAMIIGRLYYKWPHRLYIYSWVYFVASVFHIAFLSASNTMPKLNSFEYYNIPIYITIFMQFIFFFLINKKNNYICKDVSTNKFKKFISSFSNYVFFNTTVSILLFIFIGLALLFYFNYQNTILTLIWCGLIFLYALIGLIVKSKKTLKISMFSLVICSARLLIFDLVQTDPTKRVIAFVGVGCIMLVLSIIYKKFKHRIEIHETI
ncbi:MAG: hypothetical protein JXA99_11785 [Candidatus Lokiarchaeota archaeon]|nr:hypothetical protein [Candidatus Lokiarchaeota archaeon]